MVKSFEGLRGVAALSVALLHLELAARSVESMSSVYLWTAYLFVDLFFVLSGFVIGRIYENRLLSASDLGNFMVRRTGRLYPLFVFSTFAYIAIDYLTPMTKVFLGHHGFVRLFHDTAIVDTPFPPATELLSALTLTHSLGFFDRLILNYPSWTISTEYYTYLVFGVTVTFLAFRSRLPAYILLAIVGAAVAIPGSLEHDCLLKSECLYLTTDLGIFRCLLGFFLGVIAQRWAQRPEILASISTTPVQVVSVIFAGVILVYSRHEPWLAFLAPLAFFMLILSVSADTGWVAKFFGHRVPAYLGRISYSIYLMHAPVLLGFGFVIRAARGPEQFLLAAGVFVATVILVSHLTFRYIEDPFRVRANALADRLFLKRSTGNLGQAR